jgi:hypothetical protein
MSYVIAAFVVLLLLSETVLPAMDFRRRGYQLALALTAFLFVGGLAVAIFPIHDAYSALSLVSRPGSDASSEQIRNQRTLFLAIGVSVVILGLVVAKRWPTTYLGFLLAGLFVLVEAVLDQGASVSLYDTSGDAGTVANAVYTIVVGVGLLIILAYGIRQWDRGGGSG